MGVTPPQLGKIPYFFFFFETLPKECVYVCMSVCVTPFLYEENE